MVSYENPEVDHEVNVSAGSPLREFFSLSLWLALGTVLLVASLYLGARWLAPWMPFSWERRIADAVVAQWRPAEPSGPAAPSGTHGSVARQRQAWLQALADRLRPSLQLPDDMPITVHWLDSATPNAFATLGGHVFIHQGTLDRLASENAVAMVLAHEMAHVKHRDPIVALGGGLVVRLTLQALLGGNSGGAASEAAAALSQLGFSRQQERAADAAAVAALLTSYGHLADADAFFSRMLCEGQSMNTPDILQTHPDTAARVQMIRAASLAAQAAAGTPQVLPAFMHSGDKVAACAGPR